MWGDIPNRIPLVIPVLLTGEGVNIPYGDYSPLKIVRA